MELAALPLSNYAIKRGKTEAGLRHLISTPWSFSWGSFPLQCMPPSSHHVPVDVPLLCCSVCYWELLISPWAYGSLGSPFLLKYTPHRESLSPLDKPHLNLYHGGVDGVVRHISEWGWFQLSAYRPWETVGVCLNSKAGVLKELMLIWCWG